MAESEANGGDQSWRTSLLRQNVRNKIEEAIRMSGNPTSKTVSEMENHIFLKARTKEEYLSFVARLILHVKEMNSKRQQSSGMQQIVGQNPGIIGGQQVSQQESDPMSALQNMAGPQTMSEIPNGNAMHLQVSNVNSDQIMNNNQSMIPNMSNMTTNMTQNMNQNMATNMNQNMNQNINQNINQNMNQIQNINQNPNQMNQNRVQNPMAMNPNRMMSQQMMGPNNLNNPRPQVLSSNLQAQLQRIRQPNPNINVNMSGMPPVQETKFFDNQQMSQMANNNSIPQNQNQFKGQVMGGQQFSQMNPNPNMMVQNQNQGMSSMQPINQMNPSTPQMMPSPSGYAPSPSPMMPSPHGNLIRTSGSMGAPSPQNISLNTPASIMIASPGSVGPGGRTEEQIYLEKLKNLQKYVEPVRSMIARIDKDDRYSNDKKKELDKMKNLLSILTDPSRRCPMTTLEKCEQFLEKMDFTKIKTEPTVAPTVVPTIVPMIAHPVPKIQDVCQPLLDAITANIRKPLFNHTLQRTFGPAVAALTHNPYKQSSSPNNKRKYEDESDVSEVLQGEIARLDGRFKVQLDPLQHFGSKTIHLICKLDDKDLPCVPPISIQVPESYPEKPPQCSTDPLEYSASTFFVDIQKKFDSNIAKLPQHFSVTSLLNSWELSVRQAVSASLDPIGG